MLRPKKLTVAQELEILGRTLYGESQRSLAPQYGVSKSTSCTLLQEKKTAENIAAAREAAAVYYRMNPPSQNRVTHPACTLSDKSSHAMPAEI